MNNLCIQFLVLAQSSGCAQCAISGFISPDPYPIKAALAGRWRDNINSVALFSQLSCQALSVTFAGERANLDTEI